MKVYNEIYDLDAFNFWGQAESTMKLLSDEAKETLFEAIEEQWEDGIEEQELNDILAYDDDWIKDVLGYDYENYNSKEEMKEEQTQYIVDLLQGEFPDYDGDEIESFAKDIVDSGDFGEYDDAQLERAFVDECGEDHANSVLDDEISGYYDQKESFIENNWDYYATDERNIKAFREYLNEDEEYQQDLKKSYDEIDEDDKRHEKD